MTPYPDTPAERDRWILSHRTVRRAHDVWQPQQVFTEIEPDGTGDPASVLTVLLTSRECPWRCLMCDLWQHTVESEIPPGAIPAQIAAGLERARFFPAPRSGPEPARKSRDREGAGPWVRSMDGPHPAPPEPMDWGSDVAEAGKDFGAGTSRWIKLYNSGSFFDPRAVPTIDYAAIAGLVRRFDRVVVESHPTLIGRRCLEFRDLLEGTHDAGRHGPQLEVAMGLETVNPDVLERLNKRMTLAQFRRAAEVLEAAGVALRVFVLVRPPFLSEAESLDWAKRALDFAFDCKAAVVSLIPTRFGNGALEALAEAGHFAAPRIETLEAALAYGLGLGRGRVFADLWDAARWAGTAVGFAARVERLRWMNLHQRVPSPAELP